MAKHQWQGQRLPANKCDPLIGVFLGLVRGVSGGQPEFAESLAERLPADAQERGGLALDAAGMLKDQREQDLVEPEVRLRVQVA